MEDRIYTGDMRTSLGAPAAASRPLDQIEVAAARVDKAVHVIGNFLARFNGPVPTSAPADAPAACHRDNLVRLMNNIDRLESAAFALGEVG